MLMLLSVLLVAALAGPPEEVVRRNESGLAHLAEDRAEQAVAAFTDALEKLPGDHTLRRNLAAGLCALAEKRRADKRPDLALPLLDRAIELHPERLRYRVLRGRARFEAGGAQRFYAREDFAWVLERDPNHLDALVNLGHILYLDRELDRAVELWRKARAIRPQDTDIAGRLEKAERELAVEASYTELRSPHFVVRHGDSVPADRAQAVLALCSEAWEILCRRFQHWPEAVTVVTLYSPSEFRSATRVHGWVAGLSDGTIRLTVRPTDTTPALRATLYHEFTHHLVRLVATRTPEWMHEGLAQMCEPRSLDAAQARLRRTPGLEDSLLAERILAQSDPRRVSMLYDVALGFMSYLHDLSGDRGIHDLLRELGKGSDQGTALRQVYGRSRAELFADWKARLQDR